MSQQISRRDVLRGAAAGLTAVANASGGVQTRQLGRTGARVPVIGMGCGESWWKASGTEDKALEALTLALDLGITYLDTGQTYGNGTSESWIGKVIQGRRDGLFLATKITTRDGDEALRETERSLRRLGTDHLDVVHIHSLTGEEDLTAIEKKGGVLDAVRRLRDQKLTRFIGVTSHTHPDTMKTAIERHDFDCAQMALNAAMQGYFKENSSRPGHSFEGIALPAAQRKGIGVIAMKVTGRAALVGAQPDKAEAKQLIQYALSLPVSLAVIGMTDAAHLRENAEIGRTFRPMAQSTRKKFADRIARLHKAALDAHFLRHADA